MRKTLYALFAVLGLCLFAGCSDDDKNNDSPLAKQLAGEWHLASWTGEAPTDVFEAYVSFASNGSFEIYQQIEEVYYQRYTGSYTLKDSSLTGKYSFNASWNNSYEISFDESGNTLTMVGDPSSGEVSVYTRTAIPESVRNGAQDVKSVRSTMLLLF